MKSFTSYDLANKEFPQKLPPNKLICVKALSTLAKFALPLVLESIYKNLQQQNNQANTEQTLLTILLKITLSLSLSYFLELYCQYILVDYRLNLKKELSKRILQNSILFYSQSKKRSIFHINQSGTNQTQQNIQNDNQASFHSQKLSIWTKISNKMPVYVYNYHNSLLSLFFQTLNIIGVSTYLFIKLSYSLFFGLVFALIIMRKIVKVTKQMQERFFNNIQLRQKKLNLLKNFFNHLVQFKMTWLDKWMFDKIQQSQDEYQNNLQKIKYLDVWCVALWRFTSVSISSIVVIAFYFLGIQATQTITPSTLIQFLIILTMPLNALSWNIAGVRNSLRAINQLKHYIFPFRTSQVQNKNETSHSQVTKSENKLLPGQEFKIIFQQQNREQIFAIKNDILIKQGVFIKAQGKKEVEYFMRILPFILNNKMGTQIGYVQENQWQIDNILQSLIFKKIDTLEKKRKQFPQMVQLLQIFQCHQIPQFSSITAKNLSGGQKMRINLVRAFFNSKVIVINSDLTSLDLKMRQKVAVGINYLIKKYGYCVICKEIQAINQKVIQNQALITFNLQKSSKSISQQRNFFQVSYSTQVKEIIEKHSKKQSDQQKVNVSEQIITKFNSSLKDEKRRLNQLQKDENWQISRDMKKSHPSKSLDNLKWQTFTTYYKSKYHIVFLIGLISTTFFQHLYQFYMNNYVKIEHLHDGSGLSSQNVKNIIILTLLFATALFVRAYYFAVASIKESKRLSKQLDKNVIMNQMDFYQNFTQKSIIHAQNGDCQQAKSLKDPLAQQQNTNQQNLKGDLEQPQNKRTSQLGSKLIYHLTTDDAHVSDNYPWQANILFNNIATTLSSILIVFSQIPFIGIILIPIILFTVLWNNQYQNQSQRLLKVQKKVEENLLKTVHQIQEGIKVIYLYRKIQDFKQFVYQSNDKQINIQWKLSELKRKLNTKYKLMMIGFLVIIVLTFGLTGHIKNQQTNLKSIESNVFENYVEKKFGQCNLNDFIFESQQRNKSGKFAMLINYTITLANFMLFFTVSLGDTFTHALSIQRLRPLLSAQNSLKSQQRLKDFQKILKKINQNTKEHQNEPNQEMMISIKGLDFSYSKKNKREDQKKVFNNLDFQLRQRQKVQLRGKSGDGKTTLYKILCSLYKDKLNTIDYPFFISFSPQHPLILPSTKTLIQNLDPYDIFIDKKEKEQSEKTQKQLLRQVIINDLSLNPNQQTSQKSIKLISQLFDKSLDSLTYEQKIITNNLRTWLYGKNGVKIYDEPYWVDQSQCQTYIITTHQRQFKSSKSLYLQNKKIIEK